MILFIRKLIGTLSTPKYTVFRCFTTYSSGESQFVWARRYKDGMVLIPKIVGFTEGKPDGTTNSYVTTWKEIQ